MSDVIIFNLKNAVVKSSTNSSLPPVPLNPKENCRDPDVGTCGLVSLEVEESIFSPTVKGEAVIRDFDGSFASALGSYIGLGGYDILELEFHEEVQGGFNKKLYFLIYAYSQETNETSTVMEPNSIPRSIRLRLASPEFALLNYLFFEYFEGDEDMIMPISRSLTEEEEESQQGNFNSSPPSTTPTPGIQYDREGFIQYLVTRMNQLSGYNTPVFSENTKNWIWLKRNYNFYPWGKMVSPPRINQLIQMLAENAVHYNNDKAVNFFFWRGLDSWNFYSLETLVKQEPKKTYKIGADLDCPSSIKKMVSDGVVEGLFSSSDESDFLDLIRSYAFGSNYLRVHPNYSDPYARYLDSAGAHKIYEVKYDYFKDGKLWAKLPNQEFASTVGSVINCSDQSLLNNLPKNRVIEQNYGYFSPGFFNREKQVPWEYYGYTYSTRTEKDLWQNQFDISDLSGQELLWIQKEVKKPLQKAREEYARKKNLKEKWKVYKCSICCAGDSSDFTGISAAVGYGGATAVTFGDPSFEKSFNLRNTSSNLSNYEIVAAGSFTDTINFDSAKIGVGPTMGISADGSTYGMTFDANDPWIRSGMTLSYNLNESPYNLTLGEFLNLEENPDNFVLYRFDLEIKRHEKLKQILQNNIETRRIRKEKYQTALSGYTASYTDRNDVCEDAGCTGYCLCPTEYPETVKAKVDLVVGAHDSLTSHEEQILAQIDPMIEKLKTLKNEFLELYGKYWSRKAFFFSRDIDFSFLKAGNNLFNVKSITRRPIKGSKYEPFAFRKALGGYTFNNNIFYDTADKKTMYEYDVWRNISTGQNNIGGSVPITEEGIDGSDVFRLEGDDGKPTPSPYFDRNYNFAIKADFWESFESPFSNFPYSESTNEKAKGPIWYRNWLINYDITLIKPPCLNRKPPCFQGDCSCDEIVIPLRMHFETFANGETADVLTSSQKITEYAFTQLSKNCDGCKIRITSVYPSSDIKLYHPWAADELGKTFDYVDYKKSSSFFNDEVYIENLEKPPSLALEELESFVRVEFKTPIGLETLKDFLEGFIDTYGSEYFLPYIVLATAGPFGSQSARTNISVIGQDPYGFDLAVKKSKNRDDFAGMNLVFTDGKNSLDDSFRLGDEEGSILETGGSPYIDFVNPFSTSSSWLKTSQNSLFYKPKDGIADLFVPNGIQDLFAASRIERSLPAKTWWDLWISLPPIAVATFYNRWDVYGASGSSWEDISEAGVTYQGVAFYDNNSIVAEPITWTGGTGCSGGCESDPPWPLFLQPDTEQIITGAFPSDVAVTLAEDIKETSDGLGDFEKELYPGVTSTILPRDPSNYVYRFAEFPHILGLNPTGGNVGITGPVDDKKYPVISYPIGTLIWGKYLPTGITDIGFDSTTGRTFDVKFNDYNVVHRWDISRKTQYGLVSLSSDSMPSLLSLIGGIGGELEEIQEYQRWVSSKLIDWFQNSIFDNNFAGQFVVLAKQDANGCKGYQCMNPNGFPGTDGCSAGNPLCNCPCQELRPDVLAQGLTGASGLSGPLGKEPSSLELQLLEKQIHECDLIKNHPGLGKDWLGCVWDDPNSTYNCTCPCIGPKFAKYMEYNRTNATFWETPLDAPLYRTAQMALLNSNKVIIDVAGDMSVRVGDVIKLDVSLSAGYGRFHGYWLVSTIKHLFNKDVHIMRLTLSRELPHPCPT